MIDPNSDCGIRFNPNTRLPDCPLSPPDDSDQGERDYLVVELNDDGTEYSRHVVEAMSLGGAVTRAERIIEDTRGDHELAEDMTVTILVGLSDEIYSRATERLTMDEFTVVIPANIEDEDYSIDACVSCDCRGTSELVA